MDHAGNLFGKPTFLEWLPGESLFSLISRHHYLYGHTLSARTCMQFFDHRRAGSHHDLPCRLSHFVARTDGCFGEVEEVAKTHTVLAYYAAFIPADELQNAIACMASGSVAHLKLRLGILTSRFRAHHPLKACAACIEDDRAALGWAYWHVNHQFPGVWSCPKHDVLLRESTLKATGVERFQWHLPVEANLRIVDFEKSDVPPTSLDAIKNLSRLVQDVVQTASTTNIDMTRLHDVYRVELVNRQWVTLGGNLRMPEIAADFLAHVAPLRTLPELAALPTTIGQAITQLGRLLRPPRSGTHPLRHLVLIHWLFGNSAMFWRAYHAALRPEGIGPKEVWVSESQVMTERQDPRHAQLISLLADPKRSFRGAAKALGIDVGTAMAWAGQAGLAIPRRPKKLFDSLRHKVIAVLQNGADKTVVAASANVSVVTITKLLLSEPGLHAAWHLARQNQALTSARQRWLALLQTHAGLGIKYMRALEPAAYAWLYRNDRTWLDEHKPIRLIPNLGSMPPRVLWDARDRSLSAEVERAVLTLRQRGGQRIMLWQIFQLAPTLKPKLAVLHRLPLTRRVIDQALKRRTSGRSEPVLFN
jgi:Tn7-like transposition protein D/TniQ